MLSFFVAINPPTYTLALGGDLMLNAVRVGSSPLASAVPVFRTADVALANLEIPLTDAKVPTARKTAAELKARKQFVLKADPRHAAHLKNVGVDLVSLANNHAMDYGQAGLVQMRQALQKFAIKSTGAGLNGDEAGRLAVFTNSDGFRVGLLSALAFVGRGALRKCTPAGPGPGVHVLAFDGRIDEKAKTKLQSWVGTARVQCDYLVVALHWGIERQTKPTSYQVALGKAVVDAGADLVWGHHPHVLQPETRYRNGAILYSLGNLISPTPAKTGIYTLRVQTHRTLDGTFLPGTIRGGKLFTEPTRVRNVLAERILETNR